MPPTLSCTPQLAKGDSSYFPENITPTLSKYRKLMACSHVSPRGCPPAKRHMGTAASCVSWMLEMVQGEVGCGLTALWWEVQAHWSSSSFSSALCSLFFLHQTSMGCWEPWDKGKPTAACCCSAGRRRRDGDGTHEEQTPPVLLCTVPPALVLCAHCQTTALGAWGQKKAEGCVFSDARRDVQVGG